MGQLEVLFAAVVQYESRLLANGMHPDLVAQLRAAIDKLRNSTDSRGQNWSRRSGATGGLDKARATLQTQIELVGYSLYPLLKDNAALKADWVTASRIPRKPA